jgi:RNA polymerase sigma factor (sigma-70 family)
MPEAENYALPGATNDSWRAWLTTGARRSRADRRRLRGEYRGLKRMLLEGMSNGGERPHAWKDFSGAMIRHAVDDAMRSLPAQDKQVVKLAYFGGYSNREIADQVGLTEATVQRRLRRALSAISDHIQHGRAVGRRVAFALGLWLSGRWLTDSAHHISQAAAFATVTLIVATQPAIAPPAAHQAVPRHVESRTVTMPGSVIPPVPSPTPAVPANFQPPSLRLPVDLPPLPALPVKVKTPLS